MKSSRHGFTLVEIIIVVAIIGFLAVIGIPYVLNAYDHSQDKVKLRSIAEVEKAKRILVLPVLSRIPGAMGLDDESLVIDNDPVALSNLCTALRINGLDELMINGDSIQIGSLGQKASY